MDLSQLLFRRLSRNTYISSVLAKFAGGPAIFNTEFPSDQQAGWEGKKQFPRISYLFNNQVNAERSASGTLRVAVYNEMDLLQTEQIEDAVKESLEGILIKPDGESPRCFAWARTDPYILDGHAVICKEIVFDILEYPPQETTDPDPIQAINRYIKDLYPDSVVIGIDDLQDYTDPSETPVFFASLTSISDAAGPCGSTITWLNAGISIHLLCPDAALRLKIVAATHQAFAKDGDITMYDDSPMIIRNVRMDNKADYLRAGQISMTGYYGCLKDAFRTPDITGINVKSRP